MTHYREMKFWLRLLSCVEYFDYWLTAHVGCQVPSIQILTIDYETLISLQYMSFKPSGVLVNRFGRIQV